VRGLLRISPFSPEFQRADEAAQNPLFCARLQAQSKVPEVIPRRIFRLGALMVWPGLQPTAQQLVESIVAAELNGQVSAES
jgi:hypothetical protein